MRFESLFNYNKVAMLKHIVFQEYAYWVGILFYLLGSVIAYKSTRDYYRNTVIPSRLVRYNEENRWLDWNRDWQYSKPVYGYVNVFISALAGVLSWAVAIPVTIYKLTSQLSKLTPPNWL